MGPSTRATRMMSVAAVTCLTLASPAWAQAPVYRELRASTCDAADSALGPLEDEGRVRVRGYYSPAMGGTSLFTNPVRPRNYLGVHATTSYRGHGPTAVPEVMLNLTVTGPPARALVSPDSAARLALELADSAIISLPVLQLNAVGIPRPRTAARLSVALDADTYRKVLRDRFLVLRVGQDRLLLPEDGHRALRALFRVAVCQTVP